MNRTGGISDECTGSIGLTKASIRPRPLATLGLVLALAGCASLPAPLIPIGEVVKPEEIRVATVLGAARCEIAKGLNEIGELIRNARKTKTKEGDPPSGSFLIYPGTMDFTGTIKVIQTQGATLSAIIPVGTSLVKPSLGYGATQTGTRKIERQFKVSFPTERADKTERGKLVEALDAVEDAQIKLGIRALTNELDEARARHEKALQLLARIESTRKLSEKVRDLQSALPEPQNEDREIREEELDEVKARLDKAFDRLPVGIQREYRRAINDRNAALDVLNAALDILNAAIKAEKITEIGKLIKKIDGDIDGIKVDAIADIKKLREEVRAAFSARTTAKNDKAFKKKRITLAKLQEKMASHSGIPLDVSERSCKPKDEVERNDFISAAMIAQYRDTLTAAGEEAARDQAARDEAKKSDEKPKKGPGFQNVKMVITTTFTVSHRPEGGIVIDAVFANPHFTSLRPTAELSQDASDEYTIKLDFPLKRNADPAETRVVVDCKHNVATGKTICLEAPVSKNDPARFNAFRGTGDAVFRKALLDETRLFEGLTPLVEGLTPLVEGAKPEEALPADPSPVILDSFPSMF